ncbi:MAG: hypothetical protein JWO73_577 [Candidatus Taylorbacteria bacterium]|nr:hypothetical protein [Candidatus Taylorbacteria bacterium]
METKFQTSFIPKKPLTAPIISSRSGGVSIFMVLAVIIFIISLGGAGFAFAWKNHLEDAQKTSQKDLVDRRDKFNTFAIEQLKRLNTKIDTAKSVLGKHLAISDVFDIIARLTAENIQFLSLDIQVPQVDKDPLKISMHGVGTSFKAIAFQSDVFSQSTQYGRNRLLKDPVLSDLSADLLGNVYFTFTATLNTSEFAYDKTLQAALNAEKSAPASGTEDGTQH